jgi:hypothetical protein
MNSSLENMRDGSISIFIIMRETDVETRDLIARKATRDATIIFTRYICRARERAIIEAVRRPRDLVAVLQ